MKHRHIKTILLCALVIPLSTSNWIINAINKNVLTRDGYFKHLEAISTWRLLIACLLPFLMVTYGLKKRSLVLNGAVWGFLVGFILTLSNYSFIACLVTFFVSASRATKVKAHIKRKLEADFKEGGQRGWIQVLCNGGMATQFALLYLLDVGPSERPVEFDKSYSASYFSIGVLATFAACNGDTWASELGTVFSNSNPYLVTSFKRVPKQTNGGMSVAGTIFSALGDLAIGITQYLSIYYFSDRSIWDNAPPQWPLVFIGALSGFLGSLFDSLLGAKFQYSGLNKEGLIVLIPSLAVEHISGRNILDNNSVNLISTIMIGHLMPILCYSLMP